MYLCLYEIICRVNRKSPLYPTILRRAAFARGRAGSDDSGTAQNPYELMEKHELYFGKNDFLSVSLEFVALSKSMG